MAKDIIKSLLLVFAEKLIECGYQVTDEDKESGELSVRKEGMEIGKLLRTGELIFPEQELLPEQRQLFELFHKMKEVHQEFEQSKPLHVEKVHGYRILLEESDRIMAAKMGTDNKLRFVTWNYNSSHTDVENGRHFETDYRAAENDFRIRTGALERQEPFEQEELLVLYKAGLTYGAVYPKLDEDEEAALLKALAKIEKQIPNLKEELKTVSHNCELDR